jgi:hypothetical protein
VQKKQSLLSRIAAIILLSIGLVSIISLLFVEDVIQLQELDIGFTFPYLSLGTMTLLLLVLSALLRYFKAVPVWLTLYALSLPLSLIWSVVEYIEILSNFETLLEGAIGLLYAVLPLLYAGVLSTVGYYFNVQNTTESLKKLSLKGDWYISTILIASLLAYITFKNDVAAWYINALMLIVSLFVIRLAIALLIDEVKGIQWHKLIGFIRDVGLVAVLFGGAYVATFYATLSQLGDPKLLGPIIAYGMVMILYGLIIYSLGVTLTLNKDEKTVDLIGRKNWYITGAYAFVLFVTLAAKSLFSTF